MKKITQKNQFFDPVFSIISNNLLQSSSVVCSETGIPTFRKVAAFPKWGSATKRVFSLGQKIPFLASKCEVFPLPYDIDLRISWRHDLSSFVPVLRPFFGPGLPMILYLPAYEVIPPTGKGERTQSNRFFNNQILVFDLFKFGKDPLDFKLSFQDFPSRLGEK